MFIYVASLNKKNVSIGFNKYQINDSKLEYFETKGEGRKYVNSLNKKKISEKKLSKTKYS